MTSVKLYGYATSPYVRKTGAFLYYKGVDFTHIPVNPVAPEDTIGHTNGTQVPVLEIDGEWRRESSAHALWLDEVFPEKPLCPALHKTKIEEIDQWISDTFLPAIFRFAIDGEFNLKFRQIGWRLAALLNAQTPLPAEVQNRWPNLLREVPFIQDMAKHMDMSEDPQMMQMRIGMELAAHIGNGPYMGEMEQPTMLDFAVFPQLVWGYMFGIEENLSAAMHPAIKAWLLRVSGHLPENPTLLADIMQINTLESGLV